MTEITEGRQSVARWTPGEVAVAAVGVAWVVIAALWAAPAVLIVDGFVYHAMIDAFARSGSLFVDNGFTEYRSEALKLHLLRDVDGRLAPQYPGGWGIVAAPAYLAGGLRGVILINAVASALTLALIWQAARALFADRRLATHAALIYGLATFAVDYAFGVWPHGITTFLVAAALAAVATGWRGAQESPQEGAPRAELRGALVAGLVLGAGVNFRVDALFAAAPLGLWLLGASRRPHAALGLLAAGLVPGLAVAAAINHVKFGSLSPVTYGTERGAASLGYYAGLAPVAAAVWLAALALGFERVRAVAYRPRSLALIGLGALGLCLVVPPLGALAWRIAVGFWVLVVDFQAHPLPALGMAPAEDGVVRTFGVLKDALLQSLPYAAAVVLVLPRLWRGPERAELALCFLFVLVLIVPFAYGSWHGGAAKNMRYFLNLMPALAILSAVALREIGRAGDPDARFAGLAVPLVVVAALLLGALRGYGVQVILEVTLPNLIVAAIVVVSIVVLAGGARLRGPAASTLGMLVALGLFTAFLSAWGFDLAASQTQRALNLSAATRATGLPADALLVTDNTKYAELRLNRPPALTAQTHFHSGAVTPALAALVARALAEDRPVFAQGESLAERLVAAGAAGGVSPRPGTDERFGVYRMTPAAASEGSLR